MVDFDPFEITSFEDGDDRRVIVNVAGPAALLVAKAFKLGERLMTPERLIAKDAGDVYRLFDVTSVADNGPDASVSAPIRRRVPLTHRSGM